MSRKRIYFFFILVLVSLLTGRAFAIGLKTPQHPRGVVPFFKEYYPGFSRFFKDSTLLEINFSQYNREIILDSTQTIIQIRELLKGKDYYIPVAMDLEYYYRERLKVDNSETWRKVILRSIGKEAAEGAGGIELNIPVKIKSKAFKRIFGGDRVGLRVTGNISFELAGRSENREGSAVSSFEQKGNFTPKFNQTQQFQVEGKVGDKVSVKVNQNSEATFDFENTLRLTYTGDEDEIIQSIEAGNVSLSLPSTNYVSASQKHQGLFGLKTAVQFGNLNFVGIASLERGEKEKITKSGRAAENTFRIRDYEYVRNKFFFVDDFYANNFESGYNPQTMVWGTPDKGKRIKQLDVWITARPTDYDTREGWAVLDPSTVSPGDSLEVISGEQENGYFKRLSENDYEYDDYKGFFWLLNQSINEQDVVAVSYITDDGTKKGMLSDEVTDTSTVVLLKLVRAQGSTPNYPTWDLEMRNVYNLGASNISKEGFDINILWTKTGEDVDVQPIEGNNKSFIYLMGLDRLDEQGSYIEGGDKSIDVGNTDVFNRADGYLLFPSTTPFAPSSESHFKIDSSLYVNIYNIKNKSVELEQHKFHIEVTTSSVSSTFSLGFNVLEGSEVVRLNGRDLVKDKDYTIDYFGGTLQILAPEARRADADVEIEYERGSLFQLDKKTLLGGRLEYSFGERGFIGFTGLYLNKTTLDQRVRLGQEPLRNMIWDVNTALQFKPNLITKALDLLPIVETDAESKLRIEAEYAQVNPNPNTFNEESLGENNGVAYIDDFEGSKRTTPLGISYRTWVRASTPEKIRIPRLGVSFDIDRRISEQMYKMDESRLRMFWYNPYNQVPINEIWPNKDVNAQTGTTTNVLDLQWKNESIDDTLAWGGIMRSTVNFPDQKRTKFIELWIYGQVGQVNIDIGKISEDYYVRENTFTTYTKDPRPSLGNLNTEDSNQNGLLDEGEDIGLDEIPAGQPNADPWDVWKPPQETSPPFLQINGTEGNGQAQGAKYPDTEDLDGNGGLNLANDYFTYSFDLSDEFHPYINGSSNNWRLYKIPIRAFDPDLVVGEPDSNFQEIYFVRLWLNDLPRDSVWHKIRIATFDFVGNEWEEIGVAQDGDSPFVRNDSLFNITVYNTEENAEPPESYRSPPGVSGIKDRVTEAYSKEQSLVMQLNYLEPGAVAEASKQLYEKMDLINYKKLKMFIHGNPDLPQANSPLQFYLKFGASQNIYYEVGGRVYPGWDERNHLDVVLDELAKTKLEEFYQGDSASGFYYRINPDNPEQYFKAVGLPNLRNINFMIIGARNISDNTLQFYEIWLDEMRVTDVERDKGTAMRLMTDLTMADVATIRAQWEVVDADFRKIESKFGSGNTTEKQDYRMSFKLHKFFPSSWSLNIPISGSYVRSRNVPKYFFNTDRLTHYKASGWQERLEQFFGLSSLDPELERNSRITESKSLGATFQRKGSMRAPWYLKYSIDMFTFDIDWSEKEASDERNDVNDSKSISGSVQIRIPFGKDNSIRPFGWLGNGPIVRLLSKERVFYTPSSVSMGASIQDNETLKKSRLEDVPTQIVRTNSARNVSIGYKLVPSISMDFKRSFQSDAQLKGYRAKELLKAIITEGDFGVDKVINQTFGANYNPKWFSWLDQSFKYNAGFNYNLANVNTNDISSRLQVSKTFSFNLKPSTLVNKIYKPQLSQTSRGTPSRSSRPGRGKSSGKDTQSSDMQSNTRDEQDEGNDKLQESDKKKDTQQQKKSRIPSINPLILVWKFFNSWKSIGIDYRLTDNYTYFNIDRMPSVKHQFGFDPNPGVGIDTTFGKIPRLPSIKNGKSVSGNLNFDLFKNLTSTFKYNYSIDVNQTNQQKTENIASSLFFMGDDPEKNKDVWQKLVPDWQLRLSGVENWFFFGNFAKSIHLEHARNGKFTEDSRYEEQEKIKLRWTYSNNYSPFLGINITTKWGITGTLRFTTSSNFSYNPTGANNKGERSGFDVTLSYSKTSGFRIPLPFLSKKKLQNEMQFNLTMSKSNDVAYAKRPTSGSDKYIEQNKNSSLKFKPSMTYRFSKKVNGSMFFEYSSSQNKRTGKYSYFEFGINVNIAIR